MLKEVNDIMERLGEMNSKDGTVFLFVIGTPVDSGYRFAVSTNSKPPLSVFMSEFAKMQILDNFVKIKNSVEQDDLPRVGAMQ
jgi:hypothetical protein